MIFVEREKFEEEVLVTMINNSLVCFNSSYFTDENISLSAIQVSLNEFYWRSKDLYLSLVNTKLQSIVVCPDEERRMDYRLVIFWNMCFSLMIITAVLGNCAVLWIVMREFYIKDYLPFPINSNCREQKDEDRNQPVHLQSLYG